jgi:hypothetical protein
VPRLITHRFPFADAIAVFDRIARGELSQAVGIVFEYPEPEEGVVELQPRTLVFRSDRPRGAVRLGQIGAGNYAKSMPMPHFPSLAGLSLEDLCTWRKAPTPRRWRSATAFARQPPMPRAVSRSRDQRHHGGTPSQ